MNTCDDYLEDPVKDKGNIVVLEELILGIRVLEELILGIRDLVLDLLGGLIHQI
jgi:hypothetical protein